MTNFVTSLVLSAVWSKNCPNCRPTITENGEGSEVALAKLVLSLEISGHDPLSSKKAPDPRGGILVAKLEAATLILVMNRHVI